MRRPGDVLQGPALEAVRPLSRLRAGRAVLQVSCGEAGVSAYYNEFDKNAAAWLRELIKRGLIAPGDVDERSIVDVRPDDLAGYRQCHFFAGIGGWSYALRLAGWPDGREVWTGSCPCQPFSAAGKREGFADDRHLWPVWFRLISERQPATVFGEQVASKDGLGWLDTVSADMEGAGYAIGAADLCAAGVGAPHIRQRLWFVADAGSERHDGIDALLRPGEGGRLNGELSETAWCCEARGVALGDTDDARLEGRRLSAERAGELAVGPAGMGGLVNAESEQVGIPGRAWVAGNADQWAADWIACRDGKARPVEPRTFPLAHGIPARVGRLRGYGNAIVPQVAAEFIGAFLDVTETS